VTTSSRGSPCGYRRILDGAVFFNTLLGADPGAVQKELPLVRFTTSQREPEFLGVDP
jgi:hypothetical protein